MNKAENTPHSVTRARGRSHLDFFAELLDDDRDKVVGAIGTKGPNGTVYLALESDAGVRAFVVEQRWNQHRLRNYTFTLVGEERAPSQTGCPIALLDALSPVEDLWPSDRQRQRNAEHWREACLREQERAEELRQRVPVGVIVTFARPMFVRTERYKKKVGVHVRRFRFLGGRNFEALHPEVTWTIGIPRWRDQRFTVSEPAIVLPDEQMQELRYASG